jgi:hypothetical protein
MGTETIKHEGIYLGVLRTAQTMLVPKLAECTPVRFVLQNKMLVTVVETFYPLCKQRN